MSLKEKLLKTYRQLPWFKGKLRIGKMLFEKLLDTNEPYSFTAHYNIHYSIPNLIENVGIELLLNGIYENDIVEFLKKNVRDHSVFFDVGANIGSIGLPVIKCKKDIRYYGFEASPKVFKYLEQNFRNNNVPHYELFNRLVHKDDGQSVRFYESELYGKSSMAPTYTKESIIVNSVSLDKFCEDKQIETIDWLKVDVQGFELFVFVGMQKMLSKKKIKNILFEFEEWADLQAGVEPGSAQRYIRSSGYSLYDLDGKPFTGKPNETMIWAKPTL